MDAHIAVLHTKVDSLIEKQKELTGRVRANEKVVAAIGLLGSIALAFIGAGYFAPKAEACSPRLDGEPTYCPPWDDVVVCLSLDCPKLPIPQPNKSGITDQTFEDNLDPDVFDQNHYEVTIFDTRDDDPFNVAHMGHSFPTGEWIEKLRNWESRRKRTSIEDMLNSSLADYENGSDGSTESEELLQLQSDSNR